ncbi:uncharacterized protein LOC128318918 isoform X1 [Pangasianodon hypophthalmus]|uniref:uncharacterized protein LOC128318918 isoform X1 n=1 Tax=Pangasianodon hypophthalmus TaxID=310915 RepID=UPI0023077DEA|nr:uncharacterized protein LOC128318918 isoform X1 [Pangasianodon hypophthalmus]
MMWRLSVTCLLLCVSVHTAHSAIYNQGGTEGSNSVLFCENDGNVIWGKGVDGGRGDILTAQHGEEPIKHNPDPDHRYNVTSELSLQIKDLSLSDSGIYYCNSVPVVNLTVTPLKARVNQRRTEGSDTFLFCENDGNVIWGKGVDGGRGDILTAQHGEEPIKHNPDPDHRYTVLDDLSLQIKDLSLSDSGIYYCNSVPVVNLTVTPLKDSSTKSYTTASTMNNTDSVSEENKSTQTTPTRRTSTGVTHTENGASQKNIPKSSTEDIWTTSNQQNRAEGVYCLPPHP